MRRPAAGLCQLGSFLDAVVVVALGKVAARVPLQKHAKRQQQLAPKQQPVPSFEHILWGMPCACDTGPSFDMRFVGRLFWQQHVA